MSEPSAALGLRFRTLLSHPLVPVTWSIGVAVVYALFPSTDTNAVIAESVWIFGLLAWMVVA